MFEQTGLRVRQVLPYLKTSAKARFNDAQGELVTLTAMFRNGMWIHSHLANIKDLPQSRRNRHALTTEALCEDVMGEFNEFLEPSQRNELMNFCKAVKPLREQIQSHVDMGVDPDPLYLQ